MTRYLVLLRGINVGGRNKLPMAALRDLLESHGHTKVSTYIASGNVMLSSDRTAAAIKRELEEVLAAGPFVPPAERLAAFLGHELNADPLLAGVAKSLEIARAGSERVAPALGS